MNLSVYQGLPVLVTGHTGFKGAWLCTILQGLGACVYGYALHPENPSLFSTLGFAMQQELADIRDYHSVHTFMKQVRPKIVFHMAAQALVSTGRKQPIDTFSTNIMGLVHVLEASVQVGVEAVVVVSTDKVYAPQSPSCSTEAPLGGQDPYSASKTAAEFVIPPYKDRLSISIARAGNAIGGGDWAEKRLIPDIMRAVQHQQTVWLRHPKATRPWIHVSELMRAYLMLGAANLQGMHTEAFNFGAKKSVSVEEMIQEMAQYGIKPIVQHEENPALETFQLQLDSTKSASLLGWKPLYTPQQAIAYTVEEYALLSSPSRLKEIMWARMKDW